MTVWIADAHALVQRLVSVVKLSTVLQDSTTEEQSSLVRFFLWAKGLNGKAIRKNVSCLW
jgi:hypothetical protein